MKSEKSGKKLKLKSVNYVMFAYFCLLSVLILVLVDVVFFITVSTTLENQSRNRVVNVGNEVVRVIDLSPGVTLSDSVFWRYREEGIIAYILSPDGAILHPDGVEISETRIREALDHAARLKDEEDAAYRFEGFMNFCTNVSLNGESGVLLVSCSLGIVRDTVSNLQIYMLLVSGVALALAFVIAYSISQKLTRGLKSLSDSAVKLAKGDYTVQFVNVDYKEVAQLSDTLNEMRDEVKKSGDFQREILANVTHDLKTPLTMIKAYASMIKEISGDNPEKREKHLQVIIDEADRLTGLVNDVLSVSKVSSNLGNLNPKVFNLTEYLYGIISKFGYLQQSGYNLMLDIDPDRYTRADEEKIGQVIYNLMGNAVNYTGEDKTVYISLKTSMDGQRIKLSVRDTGKGIPKDELPHIWDRYYRSEENHVRPVKGTGLGLNIVKVILQSHSFDFGVESEESKGSTFWVDFPCVPAAPPEEDSGVSGD